MIAERTRTLRENDAFPRVCAHRGLSKVCPENTLPSFGAAIGVGAHEVEFDVRLSCDGVAVVCHDERVDRTADAPGAISEMEWAELRKLDFGARYGEAWRGVRVPRAEEVLDLVSGRVGINIHIKEPGNDSRLVRLVADEIRRRQLVESAYLAGATEAVLSAFVEVAPEIPRACLVSQNGPREQIRVAIKYGCARVQFRRVATQEHFHEAHDAGLACNLFYSDDFGEACEFGRAGVDVILTNCAHQLIYARDNNCTG